MAKDVDCGRTWKKEGKERERDPHIVSIQPLPI